VYNFLLVSLLNETNKNVSSFTLNNVPLFLRLIDLSMHKGISTMISNTGIIASSPGQIRTTNFDSTSAKRPYLNALLLRWLYVNVIPLSPHEKLKFSSGMWG